MKNFLIIIALFICSLVKGQVQVITLDGSKSSDSDGVIATYRWTQIGTTPSQCIITNPTLAIATVVPANGLQWQPGTYSFQLLVTDNQGGSKADTMKIIWSASTPIVDAGNPQSIQAPISSTQLKAVATVTLGIVKTWVWAQTSGPTTATFNRKDTSTVTVGNLSPGIYTFKILITDNYSAVATDSVQIIIKTANQLPKADAGPDKTITLPVNSVSIGGVDQGQNLAISWTKVSGGTAFIKSPGAPVTSVTGLQRGTYTFQKLVQNELGPSRDLVNVTVKKKCSWLASIFGCK